MRVRVAQINPTVGDLRGNLDLICEQIMFAYQSKSDVVVFPELATVGYPPRDLLYSRVLWENHPVVIDEILRLLRSHSHQLTVIVGGLHEQLSGGRVQYNAAWILDRYYGKRVVHKRLLPSYDVFDETRYFTPETVPYAPIPIHIRRDGEITTHTDVVCDILICEDIYSQDENWLKPQAYASDPVEHLAGKGPLFVLNGSPFWIGKIQETHDLVKSVCERTLQPVIWCNQVGAHDDLVTGGYSMVAAPVGVKRRSRLNTVAVKIAKPFQVDSFEVDLGAKSSDLSPTFVASRVLDETPMFFGKKVEDEDFDNWTLFRALVLHGVDYKRRCGFTEATLGLSGGIDSALVAVLAEQIYGPQNVLGVGLPSRFSSKGSIDDAQQLADNLKINFVVHSIAEMHEATKAGFLSGGRQSFNHPVTDENFQPRLRGMVLMGYSNDSKGRCILLTTGNKSEISVGYCTLYGDMCGGLSVLSDVSKTEVYDLCNFYNKYRGRAIIPTNTIEKPPSAELKEDQKDTDSLPPYNVLDPLLEMLVEDELTPEEILERSSGISNGSNDPWDGYAWRKMVHRIHKMYRNSEFKRQQMPPGAKVKKRSFGSGRRIPIAMKLTTVKRG